MPAARDEGRSRTQVKTYVPADQKETWRAAADEMGMSLSEFVRTMVQAGRREFSVPVDEFGATGGPTERGENGDDGSPDDTDATPGVDALETRILDVLRSDGPLGWEELFAAVTDELEDPVYETLSALEDAGRVDHDPREGGYSLTDDGE